MRIALPSGTGAEVAGIDEGRSRGVVIVPDIMGLRPLFDEMVARLATENRWAVAAYEPWPGGEHLSLEDRLASMGHLDHDRLLSDAAAAADALGTERTAVVGFCMGGMIALEAAATGRFDRAVPFYGMIRFPDGWNEVGRPEPIDVYASSAADGRAPVLAIVGTDDPYTPAPDVDALDALDGVTVVRFEGAEHGFVHDPDRPAHRPDDAAEAWRRAVEFVGL